MAKKPEKVTVKLNDAIEKYGGGLVDPNRELNPVTICKAKYNGDGLEVFKTPFVLDRLESGDLVEVSLKAPKTLDEMTAAELDAYAADPNRSIDISAAKNKAEKLAIIKAHEAGK